MNVIDKIETSYNKNRKAYAMEIQASKVGSMDHMA
jgi:hypothetical protein